MASFTVSDLSTAINTHRDYDIVVSLLDVGVDAEECFGQIDPLRHLVLLFDDTSGDSPYGPKMEHIDIISTFVGLRVKHDSKVLIHCHMGVSRSPAVAIGLRMMFQRESADYAILRVFSQRPEMWPNPRIIKLLDKKMEKHGALKMALSRWKGENLHNRPYGAG